MRLLVLALLLVYAGSTLASPAESVEEELFTKWAPEHGIIGAENLMFLPNGRHGGRTLVARRRFGPQEEIARIPHDMILTIESLRGTPWDSLWKELRRKGPGALRNGLKPHDKNELTAELTVQVNLLALYLCHLMRYPDTHKWGHYVLTLPRPENMTHVLFFTSDELDELRGTALHADAETLRIEVKSNFQFFKGLLSDRYKHLFSAPLSLEEFQHAYALVVSRDFGVDDSQHAVICLMPINDLANHVHPGQNNYVYQKYDGGVQLVVAPGLEGIEAGEELLNTYGSQPNYNLFKYYGFSFEDNPFDALYLSPPLAEPELEWKTELRTEATARELAMRPETVKQTVGILRLLFCIDPRVLEMVKTNEKFRQQVLDGEILEPGLELRVLDWLQKAARNPLTALIGRPEDEPVYFYRIENHRIAAAVQYRSHETRFLKKLATRVDEWEDELVLRGVIEPRVTEVEVGDYDE